MAGIAVSRWKQGTLNPHTGRDFVQFGKTESVLNKGAEKIALLFNPPPVLSLVVVFRHSRRVCRSKTFLYQTYYHIG